MKAPLAKGFSTAYKRECSQDTPTLSASPVLKATKINEDPGAQTEPEIPAFLSQSQSGKPCLPCIGGLALDNFSFLEDPLKPNRYSS